MTGYGRARNQNDRCVVSVELKTVNNRHLKISIKSPDIYAPLESQVDKVVRTKIARGTVTVTVRMSLLGGQNQYSVDTDVFQSYWQQLSSVGDKLGVTTIIDPGRLLHLPGTIQEEGLDSVKPEEDWPLIEKTLSEALDHLGEFRAREGESTKQDLERNGQVIKEQLENIVEIAPQVVVDYRNRMQERVSELLRESGATISESDLIREVSIFADRCDINEEITRLRCHLEQFDTFLAEPTSQGRKLDFLIQEMFREVNTIGSKANNVPIAHCVVEMKAAVEKIRENLQNVE